MLVYFDSYVFLLSLVMIRFFLNLRLLHKGISPWHLYCTCLSHFIFYRFKLLRSTTVIVMVHELSW
jgi:hypothetical protein